jgi:hypothetical protein
MILGQLPIEPDILASSLVREMAMAKETEWTRILKETLLRMGKKLHHEVNPDRKNGEPSQFLLDLVWWRNKRDMDIVLAVESEFGPNNEVLQDFGKLLVVKAPLKLMVFKKQTKDTVRHIEENYMQKYGQHIKGECYLLLEFDKRNKVTYSHSYQARSSGRLDSVSFEMHPLRWSSGDGVD